MTARPVGPVPNPTSAVNPSDASVEAFHLRPDDDAIIMVNLLKFAPDDGRAAYARYGAVAGQTVKARGGGAAYSGVVLGPDPAWDTVILVRYPRRAAYLDMQSDPAYVGAIPDRTAGLAARLLHPFHPRDGNPDDPFEIEAPDGDEVIVVSLVRLAEPLDEWSPPADVALRLVADLAMVSDDVWHELLVTRHRSADAVAASPIGELTADPAIAAAISLVTRPATP